MTGAPLLRPIARLALLACCAVALAALFRAHCLRHASRCRDRPRDLLLVIDVTGSMNARDYMLDGRPAARLDAAKRAGRALLAGLPCQSRLGLGIFTERRTFLLFEPAEVRENFAAIDGAIEALDWRMAWEGDSPHRPWRALRRGHRRRAENRPHFPDRRPRGTALPSSTLPAFDGKPGEVAGLLVGVGGLDPIPIPKFDDDGREVGFYAETDVPQENRSGPPPADAPSRAGWNPRNAPWGAAEAATGTEHLSALREEHLHALAAQTGLGYARLTEPSSTRRRRPQPCNAHASEWTHWSTPPPCPRPSRSSPWQPFYGVAPIAVRRSRAEQHSADRNLT